MCVLIKGNTFKYTKECVILQTANKSSTEHHISYRIIALPAFVLPSAKRGGHHNKPVPIETIWNVGLEI